MWLTWFPLNQCLAKGHMLIWALLDSINIETPENRYPSPSLWLTVAIVYYIWSFWDGRSFFIVMIKKVGWQNGKAKFTCSKGVQCTTHMRLGFEVRKHRSIFSHFHPSLLSRPTIQMPLSFLSLLNCTIRSLSRFPRRWWFYEMAYFPLT